MKLLELLKKYGYCVSFNKTDLYKEIELNKKSIVEAGFKYNTKSIIDLFNLEIVVKGIKNKQIIEQNYDKFISVNFNVLEHINYDEKRNMFNRDLDIAKSKLICFKDTVSKELIYIPYLESFINQRYINDYQMLLLKHHQEYLINYQKSTDNMIGLYGLQLYNSDFSSLQIIGRDESNYYFYHEEVKVIYIFDQATSKLIDEFYLVDKHCKVDVSIDQVKELLKLFLSSLDDVRVIEYMQKNQLLSEKNSKKIIKKLVKK